MTRADVAKLADVAESTVSRALNDSPLITEGIKKKVRDAACQLGYIPNRQAVLLASSRTMRIGVVLKTYPTFSPFSRSYFPRLLDGILEQAEELGYTLTVVLDKKNGQYKDLSRLVYSKEVDGLIFPAAPLGDPRIGQLIGHKVPLVLISNLSKDCDCVNCDPYEGTREALSHLKALGHSRIGYIGGDLEYWDGKERLRIFKKLTEEQGIVTSIAVGDFSKSSGFKGAGNLLSGAKTPTVIMTASDRCALGVMEYCKNEGISIPHDLSLVGFDNLGPAGDSVPALSTIHNPVTRMGVEAVELLDRRLSGKEILDNTRLLDSAFITRASSGVFRESSGSLPDEFKARTHRLRADGKLLRPSAFKDR